MIDYRDVFDRIEQTLIRVGSCNIPAEELRDKLNTYKRVEAKSFSDADYYRELIEIVFYSGFRAETVKRKLGVIRKHFPDPQTVAGYGADQVKAILSDPGMIKNRRRVQNCIDNTHTFRSIVQEHGSFQAYVEFFSPTESFENLMLWKEEVEYRFNGLGRITSYQFLTQTGLPMLKPDRVICRIYQRLGLIGSHEQLLTTVIHGRKFAQATGHPMRYIDIVFAVYGRVADKEFGLDRGICLERDPACSICGVTSYCHYPRRPGTNRAG